MIDLENNDNKILISESVETLDQVGHAITNNDEYSKAAELLGWIKGRIKIIEDKRKDWTRPLDEHKKKIMDFFRYPIDNYEKAKIKINNAMIKYQREQEEVRRKAEEIAREAIRKEEEQAKKLLTKQAKLAEKQGNNDASEELKRQREEFSLPVPIIESQVPRVAGTSIRINWTAEVIDLKLVPIEYHLPNLSALNQVARATKGALKIPGVIFKSEESIVSREA